MLKFESPIADMEDLYIEPTKKTPGVDLSNGVLSFTGRSMIENTRDFYEPIYTWVCKYLEDPAEITVVTMKLEYIDAASVSSLMNLLILLKGVTERDKVFMVNWYYSYGDLEMLQLGAIIQDRLEMEFDFTEFEPSNSLN
jgi:hypothetical protein